MYRRSFLSSALLLPKLITNTYAADRSQKTTPTYQIKNGEIEFHTTSGYPDKWRSIYENSLVHYANRWGRVGPTHVFLVENIDWDPTTLTDNKRLRLTNSIRQLKKDFASIQGHNSDGQYLDWQTGNHWAGWSINPSLITITMTMTPLRDARQFVIGPIHEYTHALQTANGFSPEAIDGNQMGHSRWTGPAWWREGSAVLISYLHAYQHPVLFEKLDQHLTWDQFSHEMNRNLQLFQRAKLPLQSGVTHDDWQRLEKIKKVHPVVYAGGSVACAMLLKKAGTLGNLFAFLPKISEMGWEPAFHQHFDMTLANFYKEFEATLTAMKPQLERVTQQRNWAAFLRNIN